MSAIELAEAKEVSLKKRRSFQQAGKTEKSSKAAGAARIR